MESRPLANGAPAARAELFVPPLEVPLLFLVELVTESLVLELGKVVFLVVSTYKLAVG